MPHKRGTGTPVLAYSRPTVVRRAQPVSTTIAIEPGLLLWPWRRSRLTPRLRARSTS